MPIIIAEFIVRLRRLTAGKSKTTSTSKIRKITARRKKRKEKGTRADLSGSNPHSKGDLFSRSASACFEISQAIKKTTPAKKIASILATVIEIIGTKEIKSYDLQHQCNPFSPA